MSLRFTLDAIKDSSFLLIVVVGIVINTIHIILVVDTMESVVLESQWFV